MAANTVPIYTKTPNNGYVSIPTTNAQVKSNGVSAGSGTDLMYLLLTVGADGTFLDAVRFYCVASAAATTSVATTLRVYSSSVAAPGATTAADTFLIGEISVPAISASNSINAAPYFDCYIGRPIKAGRYIHVSQHVAQTTNQNWNAESIASDY